MKRDCVFLLADSTMRACFDGFISRENFHLSLKCGRIDIDPTYDIIVAAGDHDPGLYTRAHETLRPYLNTHHHAVVVLDAEWDGSPGTADIRMHIESMLSANGWKSDHIAVIVIDPELENWIWQRNVHVAKAIGFGSLRDLFTDTDLRNAWPEGQHKPSSPKETLITVLRKNDIPLSASIYKKITKQVSVSDCSDRAFLQLVEKLRNWFPPDSV